MIKKIEKKKIVKSKEPVKKKRSVTELENLLSKANESILSLTVKFESLQEALEDTEINAMIRIKRLKGMLDEQLTEKLNNIDEARINYNTLQDDNERCNLELIKLRRNAKDSKWAVRIFAVICIALVGLIMSIIK